MQGRKIKILLCAPYKTFSGGIAKWTDHIVQYYQSNNENDLWMNIFSLARGKQVYADTPLIKRILYGFAEYKPLLKKYRKKIYSEKYDIAHITSSASLGLIRDILMLKITRKNQTKSILHFHFGRIPELYKKNNWEKKLLDKTIHMADEIIVIDQSSFNTLINQGYKNIKLLPNPLGPDVEEIIKNSSIKRKKNKIVFAGHVVSTKGVFELVQACKDIIDIEVHILGAVTAEMKSRLYEAAGNNKTWLKIAGEQNYETVIKEMLSANIFVLPTYTEGFPNVILESMACGCPIVASAVGAIPEMLNIDGDEPAGICIEPKNIEQLKSAIIKMLNDDKLASTYGSNAKKRVNEMYSMPSVWKQMTDIWKSVIE